MILYDKILNEMIYSNLLNFFKLIFFHKIKKK
jgi:hypothetical protein